MALSLPSVVAVDEMIVSLIGVGVKDFALGPDSSLPVTVASSSQGRGSQDCVNQTQVSTGWRLKGADVPTTYTLAYFSTAIV